MTDRIEHCLYMPHAMALRRKTGFQVYHANWPAPGSEARLYMPDFVLPAAASGTRAQGLDRLSGANLYI